MTTKTSSFRKDIPDYCIYFSDYNANVFSFLFSLPLFGKAVFAIQRKHFCRLFSKANNFSGGKTACAPPTTTYYYQTFIKSLNCSFKLDSS
ncbi:MAG: hypothetical protein JST67_11180 [Bacteroidetes bacterium]|nr:hypothetical protein [Bacteroidota bacterium]